MIEVPSGKLLVGIDEVGYGSLAGDVTVCAAHIPPEHWDEVKDQGFRDSKRLSVNRRRTMHAWTLDNPGKIRWGLSSRNATAIESYGPLDAKHLAAMAALVMLSRQLDVGLDMFHLVVDGDVPIPGLPSGASQVLLPHADDLVLPCSVASVIAKVTRDADMYQLSKQYPAYGFDSHNGYTTKQHLKAVFQLGPIPGIHRPSYLKTALKTWAAKETLRLPAWYRTL